MSSSIADRIEIEQLLARYTHAADIHPPEAMRDIFAADGRFHIEAMGIDVRGLDNIIHFFTEMRSQMAGMYHINTNLVVDIDGHTATAISYLSTLQSGPEPKIVSFSRYEDDLVKTPGGWRIQSRSIDM